MHSSKKPLAQIALPVGARQTFTYAIPPELEATLAPGHRVRVPFGRRIAFGYVVGFTSEMPPGKLRAILALEPEEVLFTPEILRLTEWSAGYYLAPWGQVLEAALPLRCAGAQSAGSARSPPPRGGGGGGDRGDREGDAGARAGRCRRTIGAAVAAGGFQRVSPARGHRERQDRSLHGGGRTGRAGGRRSALPRARDRHGHADPGPCATEVRGQVGLFHSQTGEARRHQVWREAREGRLSVVVGTRSAVFVPMPGSVWCDR